MRDFVRYPSAPQNENEKMKWKKRKKKKSVNAEKKWKKTVCVFIKSSVYNND